MSTRERVRGARAQAESNAVLERWLKDLQWRVMASEGEIKRRFEPDLKTNVVACKRIDETETAFEKQPERVLGMMVRYTQKEVELVKEDDMAS